MRLITASTAFVTLLAATPALADGCRYGGPGMTPAGMYQPGMPMAYGAPHPMAGWGHSKGYGHGYGKGYAKGHGKGYGMSYAKSDGKGYGDAAAAPKATAHGGTSEAGAGDIVDIAASAGSFSTLVSAVQAAGLVDTLKGDGPFTVFAPTDEAFDKVPPVLLQALLNDKAALKDVLTYHVVPGKVMAADVAKLSAARTVQGQEVRIDTADGVKVDGASVVKTDIVADNGVIHVIDQVILPN
jgi:uncharacterized surface protein with fasciclin (FAS1) repeats